MAECPSLPLLGVGFVFAPGLEPLLSPGNAQLNVVEIEPQTLWTRGSPEVPHIPHGIVEWLRGLPFAKIVHGVGAPVAGTVQAPAEFVTGFARSTRELGAHWASEHLSFNRVSGMHGVQDTGLLLPPLQTDAGVQVAASNVLKMKRALQVPFAIETPVSYLRPRSGELPDGEFLARVVDQADCGILLDLHNLWANERNGRQPVAEFLDSIPLERVWEIHVAGGFERKGFWLDAHSGAVPNEVLEIAADLVPRLPNLRALIFEILSSYVPLFGLAAVESELVRLHEVWGARESPSIELAPREHQAHLTTTESDFESVSEWERCLGDLLTSRDEGTDLPTHSDLASDPGIPIMQDLVWQFRAGAIVDLLSGSTRLIMQAEGEGGLRDLLDGYFVEHAPEIFSLDEAMAFARYLDSHRPAIAGLSAVLDEDLAQLREMSDVLVGEIHAV